jgi:hypothetical protein
VVQRLLLKFTIFSKDRRFHAAITGLGKTTNKNIKSQNKKLSTTTNTVHNAKQKTKNKTKNVECHILLAAASSAYGISEAGEQLDWGLG